MSACACVCKVCPRARNNNNNNNTVKVLYEETPSAAKIEKIIHRIGFLRELLGCQWQILVRGAPLAATNKSHKKKEKKNAVCV